MMYLFGFSPNEAPKLSLVTLFTYVLVCKNQGSNLALL